MSKKLKEILPKHPAPIDTTGCKHSIVFTTSLGIANESCLHCKAVLVKKEHAELLLGSALESERQVERIRELESALSKAVERLKWYRTEQGLSEYQGNFRALDLILRDVLERKDGIKASRVG